MEIIWTPPVVTKSGKFCDGCIYLKKPGMHSFFIMTTYSSVPNLEGILHAYIYLYIYM